mmetsp:Transcript_20580/g.19913  ORF Transcript_20580/g.19913 Transcript_20580/m.19913 type:complete len:255 (+) Transcript_20580:163-927(+)
MMLHYLSIVILLVFMEKQCVSLLHVLSGGLRVHKAGPGYKFESHSRTTTTTAIYCTAEGEEAPVSIKLPVIQIIKANEITGEFICGNELVMSVDKFLSALKSLEKETPNPSVGNYGVSNMYSDDQLNGVLESSQDTVILKLFRVGCKKCAKLEPIYEALSHDPVYSKFQFIQADVAYCETYKKNLKDRLMGLRGGQNDDTENCMTCQNTGFIDCIDCEGKGYIKKGTLAAFCPSCTGYKKNRCSACGGKCFKCA